jgi:hypothetical protein
MLPPTNACADACVAASNPLSANPDTTKTFLIFIETPFLLSVDDP